MSSYITISFDDFTHIIANHGFPGIVNHAIEKLPKVENGIESNYDKASFDIVGTSMGGILIRVDGIIQSYKIEVNAPRTWRKYLLGV
jgi:hypothetical protein